MKISYNWLQKYFVEKLPEPEKISEGIIFHAFEIEEVEKVGNDTVFDIKILPDRAHDCLSHWGIAKEVSAIFNLRMKILTQLPRQDLGNNGGLEIEIKDNHCRRYMGRIVKGVKVGPSPAWLNEALTSIGQKSINNIVDATNYVMYDLGNPIHAFDLDKLASLKIIIDKASNDEKFILLDGREVILDASILTIRDEKEALVVAGVKGGKKAEVGPETLNIMIEVANFEPVTVRKTSKKLGILTDSAKRFENEITPSLAPLAMEAVTKLILEIAGGEAYQLVDVYSDEESDKSISFSIKYLNNLIGIEISKESIDDILHRFNYEYKNEGETYEIKIPSLRLDLQGPHDLAEEIARIYGYDKVTPILPKIDFKIKENRTWLKINQAREYLVSEGYREVMNYAFTSKGDVEVLASASDKNFLRTNLTDGLKKSYELNKLNLSLVGGTDIKIFEIGTVFPKGVEVINVGLANKKEVREMSLEEFCRKELPENSLSNSFPEVLGRGGREPVPDHLEKNSSSEFSKNFFKPWSLYPFIARDIAVWLPVEEKSEELKKILIGEGTDLLIKEPTLFDSFSKDGRTSYAYHLVFQSYDKTLTDEEINPIMERINQNISAKGWQVR